MLLIIRPKFSPKSIGRFLVAVNPATLVETDFVGLFLMVDLNLLTITDLYSASLLEG